MAIIYVRSTDGSDADNGSTWALAKATLAGAAAIAVAGDTIYVSHVHAETAASAKTITLAGTAASPIRVICVNDGAEPPTTVATTGSVTTTGGNNIAIGGWSYFYGVKFSAGSGNVNANLSLLATSNNVGQTFERCTFTLGSTAGSAQRLNVGSSASGNDRIATLINCDVVFSGTGNGFSVFLGKLVWRGGTVTGSAPSSSEGMFVLGSGGIYSGFADVSGVDMSGLGAGAYIVKPTLADGAFLMRNCRLPTSWSGSLLTSAPTTCPHTTYKMHNCDNADTNYRLWEESYTGSTKSETTLVKTGGSSDGTTPFSLKMTSNANTKIYLAQLESPELPAIWNATVGSAITVTVDILHDSVTDLKDDEVWLEVSYLGTSGFPVATLITDSKADIFATAAAQTASSATWTTTGMSNPNEQKLAVTFTPQEAGFIQARVILAKASTTIYVDAKQQVS